jgi:hypothetical protein
MSVKKLLASLSGLGAIVEAAGAKKAAEGLRALKGLFVGESDRPAAEALDELRNVLNAEKPAEREAYVKRLVDAGSDDAKFNTTVDELQKDKRMDKEDVDAIAHAFIGGRTKWPSRKAAVEALRKKFAERAYQASKMRIVEKYKVG